MFDVWLLLQPSSIVVAAVAAAFVALLLRWRALSALLIALSLLLLGAATFLDLGTRLAWELERRVPPSRELPSEVHGILVLGGAVEWRQTRAWGRLNTNAAAERLMAASGLATRYPEAKLVLTGIYRELIPDDLTARPDADSLLFGPQFRDRQVTFIGEARSTYEEGLLAIERLQPRAGERWLLVTSAMHMPRALATFETLGWRLEPYPVDYRSAGEPGWINDRPRPGEALAALDEAVREWGALLVYRRTGRIR